MIDDRTRPIPERASGVSDLRIFWDLHVPRLLLLGRETPLRELSSVAHFAVDGEEGGDWTVVLRDGRLESIEEGVPTHPTVTVRIAAEEFLRIATGRVDYRESFFGGRVAVTGDLETLLTAASWIPLLIERFPFDPECYREGEGEEDR